MFRNADETTTSTSTTETPLGTEEILALLAAAMNPNYQFSGPSEEKVPAPTTSEEPLETSSKRARRSESLLPLAPLPPLPKLPPLPPRPRELVVGFEEPALLRNQNAFETSARQLLSMYPPPRTLAGLLSSCELRAEFLKITQHLLYPLHMKGCFQDLFNLGLVAGSKVSRLKSGTYGVVNKFAFADFPNYPVVAKTLPMKLEPNTTLSTHREQLWEIYDEILYGYVFNALVSLKMCPFFPLLYQPMACPSVLYPGFISEVNIFFEAAQNNVQHWLNASHSTHDYFMLVFQIFAAILAAQSLFGIVNNDVKADNMFFVSLNAKTQFRYTVFGKSYLFVSQWLFMLGDWGLASGGGQNRRSHEFAPNLVQKESQTILESWQDPQAWHDAYLNHPLGYRKRSTGQPIPPMKRDYLFLLYALLRVGVADPHKQKNMPIRFLQQALIFLDTIPDLDSLALQVDFFHHLFSEAFFQQCGFTPEDFAKVFQDPTKEFFSTQTLILDKHDPVTGIDATWLVQKHVRATAPPLRLSLSESSSSSAPGPSVPFPLL